MAKPRRKKVLSSAGEDWDAIASKYEELGGVRPKSRSTLPNRYQRLKTKFVLVQGRDSVRLIQAKINIEKAQETEKWQRIAQEVENLGGKTYTVRQPQTIGHFFRMLTLSRPMHFAAATNGLWSRAAPRFSELWKQTQRIAATVE
ncbi:hypothetical protein ANO11243_026430 [Dothideomycetidae sp. 11243]|nr:hypothetical protein ANO11243_026430 [fungal sp. No.11243]